MTPERLKRIFEAYGADPARWPEGERAAALGLGAERERDDARELDRALDAWSVAPMRLDPLRLTARAAQPRRPQIRLAWPNLVGLAAAAVIGFVAGFSGIDDTLAPYRAEADGVEAIGSILIEDELAW
jgi:hypothetical protein